ncbi:hypothetical protein O181_058969 [Austropuccinia psidii MF-1]|uniref:Reverse transcriptase Ty1/copia-type domain-containing protein n=1 Tax=Austropuccinia psidii MF-1 TaxID=1389203 RepID=A0A9Q3EDE7_9BASI|nr:hypothetical protein [Austropuccinia psidii MF-1]
MQHGFTTGHYMVIASRPPMKFYQKYLSARAIVSYHLGIAPDSKGWLFWVPKSKRITRAENVKFDESNFFLYPVRNQSSAMSIQAETLFDSSMIKELEKQDSFISTINHIHDLCNITPTTYKEAISSDEQVQWQAAIVEELNSMNQEKLFEDISIRNALKEVPHNSIFSTTWVFVRKHKPERYKAQLVARGFRQIHSINFDETFAPTPTFGALHLLFLIVCTNNWPIQTFDVKVAFLHSLIDKLVYVWPPKGINVPKHTILKLWKALCGTKQAARCWWLHLKMILEQIGLCPNGEDQSTYCYKTDKGRAILWIHVDDSVLTASTSKVLNDISNELNKAFKMKWDDTISSLVGISITCTDDGYEFSQKDLILKLLGWNQSNITAKSPLPANCDLKSNKSGDLDKDYLRRIGMLLYIVQGSRPNICYLVNYLAQFSMATDDTHWQALEHLIAYPRGTIKDKIIISKNQETPTFNCYVDANWGGEGNRSNHGFIIMHGRNPITWQSKQQATVAASTAQAEYIALSFSSRECLWLANLSG